MFSDCLPGLELCGLGDIGFRVLGGLFEGVVLVVVIWFLNCGVCMV